MTTSYPAGLDSYTNPTATDELDDEVGTRTHSEFHADNNDAIEAIQAELGTDPSGSEATVKARIAADESALAAHLADTVDAHDASAVSFVAVGTIAGTDVQTAVAEVATDAATALAAEAVLARNADNLTSGTVADARIASTISRDSEVAAAYQPLDSDLTAIAALSTTPYGRAVLELANQAALSALVDHGGLAGLSDDDHTQYVLVAGTRSGAQVVLQAGNATHVPLRVQGATAQSANLQQWQNSVGAAVATIRATGKASLPAGIYTEYFEDLTEVGPYFWMTSGSIIVTNRTTASNIPLIVKGMAAQSGALQQWQNSAGAVLASVSAAGLGSFAGVTLPGSTDRLKFGHADQAQTTVGAAGGASALPATPTKYFKVKDSGGTEYVIPAYAAA